jgi:hypothetical protein
VSEKCRLASLRHQHRTTKCKGTWTTCYLARLYQPYTELTADQAVTVCQTLNVKLIETFLAPTPHNTHHRCQRHLTDSAIPSPTLSVEEYLNGLCKLYSFLQLLVLSLVLLCFSRTISNGDGGRIIKAEGGHVCAGQ